MDINSFRSRMGDLSEAWASKVLGVGRGEYGEPDLIDNEKFLEVKGHFMNSKGKTSPNYYSWTAMGPQLNYPKQKGFTDLTPYWALCRYWMSKQSDEIEDGIETEALEGLVYNRDMWVAPWWWGAQFEVHPGKTNDYVYLKPRPADKTKKPLPRTYKTVEVEGGIVHLTAGVRKNHFKYLLNGREA